MAFTDADGTRSPGDEGTRREPAGSPAPSAAAGTHPETEPRGVPPAGLPPTLGPYRLLPHIVPVCDIGREGRRHDFAMHLVEGRPLDRILDEGPLPPREAARVAMRVAEALRRKGLESLRKAFELGWEDFEHVRKDSDLDAVRSMPEFEALCREFESAKKK